MVYFSCANAIFNIYEVVFILILLHLIYFFEIRNQFHFTQHIQELSQYLPENTSRKCQ